MDELEEKLKVLQYVCMVMYKHMGSLSDDKLEEYAGAVSTFYGDMLQISGKDERATPYIQGIKIACEALTNMPLGEISEEVRARYPRNDQKYKAHIWYREGLKTVILDAFLGAIDLFKEEIDTIESKQAEQQKLEAKEEKEKSGAALSQIADKFIEAIKGFLPPPAPTPKGPEHADKPKLALDANPSTPNRP